jgi:glycine/D-amino acid oxidase-like deaminating enzyme
LPIAMRSEDPVVVVGAGIVGLATAYWLAVDGVRVRVLDRGAVGEGASFANGGWVNRSDAVPLPAPGVARFALAKLGRADSPIYVRPRADPHQIAWLLRFAANCRRAPFERGAAALTALAGPAAELYDELRAAGVGFRFPRCGHLHVFVDRKRMQSTIAAAGLLRAIGYDDQHEVLGGEEVRDLEPVLGTRVAAGVLFPNERHVDPYELTRGLAATLTELGVAIDTDVEVHGFASAGGRVTGCVTAQSVIRADRIVLTAGADTPRLAKRLGARVPVLAGKGYSFSVRLDPQPRRTLLLGDSKVGLTPLSEGTRVLGTMEFSDHRRVVRRQRIEAMLRALRLYVDDVPAAHAEDVADAWVGLRPMTSDGLPVLDRLRHHDNVFIGTGHGMLGVMLGAATGRALAEYVRTGRRPDVLAPFAMARFARRAAARTPAGRRRAAVVA